MVISELTLTVTLAYGLRPSRSATASGLPGNADDCGLQLG
jgi:hypothetical protein